MKNDDPIIEMFGLTDKQTQLMFSVQKMITKYDIQLTENEKIAAKKNIEYKKRWLEQWENNINDYLNRSTDEKITNLIETNKLKDELIIEIKKSSNRTWYYILLLECISFCPYTPLEDNVDKHYTYRSFNSKKCYLKLKEFFVNQDYITDDFIEKLHSTYRKSLNKISGKSNQIAAEVLGVITISALVALTATISAGPIAVALLGSKFAALHGIALTHACLALLGGGAIAIGGSGIAGGVAVIAGGGALLGLAGGGTIVGLASQLILSSPEFTLTQSAKLETILKEVILNAQKDVILAQEIIEQYKTQINELNEKVTELETQDKKAKNEIKNIKKSISYLKRSCKNMIEFTSAFEIGLEVEEQ